MGAGFGRSRYPASDFDYRLRRCEGSRVDSPRGRVGLVGHLRFGSSAERPGALAIRAGLVGTVLIIVPVGEIEEILPKQRRIVLRRSPRPTATERLHDLGRRLSGGGAAAAETEPRSGRPQLKGEGGARALPGPIRVGTSGRVDALIARRARQVRLRLGRGGEREVQLAEQVRLRLGRGGRREVTTEAEVSAEEATAKEPAEAVREAAAEEPSVEEAPAEEAAEPSAEPAEETPASEEAGAEEAAEEETAPEEPAGEAPEEAATEETAAEEASEESPEASE